MPDRQRVSTACVSGRVARFDMWNDTDSPIAYFISFRCYGTWLHGDERGSTDRFHNIYQEPFIESNPKWQDYEQSLLKSSPFVLDAKCRKAVELAIIEVVDHRNWYLHAINVRTNHAHTVVTATEHASKSVLNAFKTYATRRLRSEGMWTHNHSPWSDKGSRRRIWNAQGLAAAVDYVRNGQGGPLPDFD